MSDISWVFGILQRYGAYTDDMAGNPDKAFKALEELQKSGKLSESDAKTVSERTGGGKPTSKTKQISDRVKKESAERATPKPKLSEYVEKHRRGERIPREIVVSKVGKKERERLCELLGEEFDMTEHVIQLDEIKHIEGDHAESGKSDQSMSDAEEYDKIPDIIANFDSIEFGRNKDGSIRTSKKYRDRTGKKAKVVVYTKIERDRSHTVVEAVCDTVSGKLHVMSCYSKSIHDSKKK